MSSDYYRRQIQHALEEVARLQAEKGREAEKVARQSRLANDAAVALRASSPSTATSKSREAARHREEEARSQKRLAEIETRIARSHKQLTGAQRSLSREEERELRDRTHMARRQARANESRLSSITSKLQEHASIHEQTLRALGRLQQLPAELVVLFLASNPIDQPQLRLDEEARSIEEMIRKSEHRGAVKLKSCWAARPGDLIQAINEHSPGIVHFSGHGSDSDELVFQNELGGTKLVTREAIVQTMATVSDGVRLVFFNACYSRGQAEAVVRHIPAAIGMVAEIGDEAARVFAAQFYSSIGFSLSVGRAFQQAKAALLLEGIPEADTPELFTSDGVDPEQLMLIETSSQAAV